MSSQLQSSAPHVCNASSCDPGSLSKVSTTANLKTVAGSAACLLWQDETGLPEAGIRILVAGIMKHTFANDELCHVVSGNAVYKADTGEVIEVKPGTVVHFKQGWHGVVEVTGGIRMVYMKTKGGEVAETSVLHEVDNIKQLTDWGSVEQPIDGVSKVSGILLSREADGSAESGIWVCTPGTWRCVLTSDELCHFLKGRCTYTHDNGEVIEITADTAAFFPQGWSGQCQVHETVQKVYMIR